MLLAFVRFILRVRPTTPTPVRTFVPAVTPLPDDAELMVPAIYRLGQSSTKMSSRRNIA